MLTTIHRRKPPEFATKAAHDRYYSYVVVKPLALDDSDILGHYRTRRAAEQAAKTMFLETAPQVMTRHELQQLTATLAEASG